MLVHDYLVQAYELAQTSTDQSNQNGAILLSADGLEIIGQGANNFPNGVAWTEERALTRPKKYHYYEHAEAWAVHDASRRGQSTLGSIMVCPWASCSNCARTMIVSGVAKLIIHRERMQMTPERWQVDVADALSMMRESGITIEEFTGPVHAPLVLVNGEVWSPREAPQEKGVGNWFTPMAKG